MSANNLRHFSISTMTRKLISCDWFRVFPLFWYFQWISHAIRIPAFILMFRKITFPFISEPVSKLSNCKKNGIGKMTTTRGSRRRKWRWQRNNNDMFYKYLLVSSGKFPFAHTLRLSFAFLSTLLPLLIFVNGLRCKWGTINGTKYNY